MRSVAVATASLLLAAAPARAQSGPVPYALTEVEDGGVPACSLRGPADALVQLDFVSRKDERVFLSLESAAWRLGPDSHGPVTFSFGSSAATLPFTRVSATRMTTELDKDRDPDTVIFTHLADAAKVDIMFPSGDVIHISGPDGTTSDALDHCVDKQSAAATPPPPQPAPSSPPTPDVSRIDGYAVAFYARSANQAPYCLVLGPLGRGPKLAVLLLANRNATLVVSDEALKPRPAGTYPVTLAVGAATLARSFTSNGPGEFRLQLSPTDIDGPFLSHLFDGQQVKMVLPGGKTDLIAGPTVKVRDASEVCYRRL